MIKNTFLLLLIAIIYACATVQSPTGGEKDEKNPILYESSPENQSVNFEGTEIKLFFNEWMKLEQIQNELIITPRQDIKYEADLNKQELTIELEEPLKDSTTYTFNFRKALKDITEGNLWENPTIAFSTGPFLDSLEVSGTILKLKENSPVKDYMVGLYSADIDTANLRQGKPVYFTTTDEEGQFIMKNIKAGTYRLYAFYDANDDLINQPKSEAFGFHESEIQLYDSLGKININTYKRNEDTLKMKKFSPAGKDFVIQYNKGISYYDILNPTDSNQYIYANNIEGSKNLQIYKENFPDLGYQTDSTLLIVEVKDSLNSSRTDSVYFKLRESRITNDTIALTTKPESKIKSGREHFQFEFSKPIHSINYDSILLRYDTIPIASLQADELDLNFNRKSILISKKLTKELESMISDSLDAAYAQMLSDSTQALAQSDSLDSNSLDTLSAQKDSINVDANNGPPAKRKATNDKLNFYFAKGAIIGIENDSLNNTTASFTFKKPEDYGIIKGQVINADFPFIIELTTDNYEVVDTIQNQEEFTFNLVKPGDYRLRLIKDQNNNNKWDAGNPLTLQASEDIIFYKELITVKANWEVIDKNFDFTVDNEVDKGVKNDDL